MALALSLSICAHAGDFDVNQFMLQRGLKIFPLSNIPLEQFFTHQYYVSVTPNGLQLSHHHGKNQNVKEISRGDIHYIGTNNGEWGGKLVVEKGDSHQQLLRGNIVSLVPVGTRLFVVEGLAHLGLSSGSIFVIPHINEPHDPNLITRLPDAPVLVYLDNTRPDFFRIILVGPYSVMSLDQFNTLSILYWDAFWNFGLTPTSIVRYEDNYFVGLPHGVAVIPAPFGPSSAYCRDDSKYLPPNSCTHVRFYADLDFRNKFMPN